MLNLKAHHDLGMLSLVVSDVPGLYVHDKIEKQWYEAEGIGQRAQATLLAGRELMRKCCSTDPFHTCVDTISLSDFTNNLYQSGGHSVVADANQSLPSVNQSRHSIVYILRADWATPILYTALTSKITGSHPPDRVEGELAGALFNRINRAHFSVNIKPEERAEQKRKLFEKKKRAAMVTAESPVPVKEKVEDEILS
jgi:isopenicillin N synthase-like dioxygenase